MFGNSSKSEASTPSNIPLFSQQRVGYQQKSAIDTTSVPAIHFSERRASSTKLKYFGMWDVDIQLLCDFLSISDACTPNFKGYMLKRRGCMNSVCKSQNWSTAAAEMASDGYVLQTRDAYLRMLFDWAIVSGPIFKTGSWEKGNVSFSPSNSSLDSLTSSNSTIA